MLCFLHFDGGLGVVTIFLIMNFKNQCSKYFYGIYVLRNQKDFEKNTMKISFTIVLYYNFFTPTVPVKKWNDFPENTDLISIIDTQITPI